MALPNNVEKIYKDLVKASNVKWKNFSSKDEQIKFLRKLYTDKKNFSRGKNDMKRFLWKHFFPMLEWNMFLELYNDKKIHSRKMSKLSKKLFHFNRNNTRGGCIFTAIAGAIAAISAAASSAAGTIAGTAAAVGTAIAGSTVASSAVAGVVTGAATVAGASIADKIIN
jgi:hypothetical protein